MKPANFVLFLFCISGVFFIAGSVAAGTFYIPAWNEVIRGVVAMFWVGVCLGFTIAWISDDVKTPGK